MPVALPTPPFNRLLRPIAFEWLTRTSIWLLDFEKNIINTNFQFPITISSMLSCIIAAVIRYTQILIIFCIYVSKMRICYFICIFFAVLGFILIVTIL